MDSEQNNEEKLFEGDAERDIKMRIVELSKPDMLDLRANTNAVILVLTDLMTLQTELMKVLLEKAVLSEEEIQAVYATTGNREIVTRAYGAVYDRYATYFEKAREVIRENVDSQEQQTVNLDDMADVASTATPSHDDQPPKGRYSY